MLVIKTGPSLHRLAVLLLLADIVDGKKINLFRSAIKTGWLAGQMGRGACFYCVLNAENTVIKLSFLPAHIVQMKRV